MKRGYILLEVAVGGVLIAVLCATLLSSLADARVRNVVAGRNVVAAELALEKIEQERSLGFANLGADSPASCSTGGITDTPSGVNGAYTRVCTILANVNWTNFVEFEPGTPAHAPPTVSCKPIKVVVSWHADVGGQNVLQQTTEFSQVCK